ncbi:HDOD domain-containing protein [Curvibacter sp. APW13]|uniref:HDOD domain-containing protein n=1 Tax=Curvibacter sp. APW13 TaxID=3077236 RepID=UPI0028DFBE16|nr:HDOD domain-containing protein [Curvibacter sp. APW13]MDT8991631.1 HDOD domain-containing protein [Curvibacter sp. APW13]
MSLKELLQQPFHVPSVPRVVAVLLTELEHPVADLRRITQQISTDPALTLRLLQWANAESVGLRGQISSVSEALALLSLADVKKVAKEAAAGATLKAVPGISLPQFWTYSLNVAKVSRSLAAVVRQNQQAAFTCGLIHGLGELAMHLAMPEDMAALDAKVKPLDLKRAKAERQQFGYCWASVGAGYAQAWGLPQTLVDALEHQYAPFENDVYEPLAGVIHLATWRARCKEATLDDREMAVTFPGFVGEVLGLDIDMVLQQDPFDWAAHT